MNKKFILKIVLVVIFLMPLIYIGIGGFGYYKWVKTKNVIAASGMQLYAGTLGAVTPGCTYTQSGCTCTFCNTCGCNTYDQAIISIGQEVNKGAQYLCVSSMLPVKGSPLISSTGKQFIAGSLTGQCLTGNAVLATPSMAASNFEKIFAFIDNYIIAGFRDKIK